LSRATINGVTIKDIPFSTTSPMSIMKLDFFTKRIKRNTINLEATQHKCVTPFGEFPTVGEIVVQIDISGKVWEHTILIVERINVDVIFGWDFFCQTGANFGSFNGKYCVYWLDDQE